MTDAFDELRASARFHHLDEWSGADAWLLGVSTTSTSLYRARIGAVHFDAEGRWTRASLEGATWLRGLDGQVLDRFGTAVNVLPDEVHHKVVSLVTAAARDAGTPGPELMKLASWSVERLKAEASRFLTVYRPLGIMPPDRYQSLIIQATHGCAWNGCTFCSLYRGQPSKVVPLDELKEHVRAVKRFVGGALATRRGIFLGEANALATPHEALEGIFEVLHAELPGLMALTADPAGGVASFIDAFTDAPRPAANYRALVERGLRRVFVGVESGDEPTLRFLKKPATREGVSLLVSTLKEAGASVGVILLVGAAGLEGSARHVEASASLINALPLEVHDVVYLSPLVTQPGGRFEKAAQRADLTLLNPEQLREEELALRHALRTPAQVARYLVQRFVYG